MTATRPDSSETYLVLVYTCSDWVLAIEKDETMPLGDVPGGRTVRTSADGTIEEVFLLFSESTWKLGRRTLR